MSLTPQPDYSCQSPEAFDPDEVVKRLETSESTRVAGEMMVLALVGALLIPWLFIYSPVFTPISLVLLFVFLIWAKSRRKRDVTRERECRELLVEVELLAQQNASSAAEALPALRMLSLPFSGETRETRRVAGELARSIRAIRRQNIPIAAAPPLPSRADLPVTPDTPADEVA